MAELVMITFEPYLPRLPVRQGGVVGADGHFHHRQCLGIEDLVLVSAEGPQVMTSIPKELIVV